jgi:photosystem II PsbJ protein
MQDSLLALIGNEKYRFLCIFLGVLYIFMEGFYNSLCDFLMIVNILFFMFILIQLLEWFEDYLKSLFSRVNLRNGRVPLWFVGVGAGLAALVLLSVFFFGAYSGLGSSL